MSSNNKKQMSDAEARILERQRQVAAALASKTTLGGSYDQQSTSTTRKNVQQQPVTIDLTKPQMKGSVSATGTTMMQQKQIQRQKVKSVLKKPPPPPPRPRPPTGGAPIKRPAMRKKGATTSPPTSAAAALAQAKSRVEYSKQSTTLEHKQPPTKKARPITSALQRKSAGGAAGVSKLAQLVSASAQTSISSSTIPTSEYDSIEPDDFWKNIRDWDLLRHLFMERSSNNSHKRQSTSSSKSSSTSSTPSAASSLDLAKNNKPIPNTFISPRHYCSAWAPLCLNEARAQLLSEVMQEIPYWHKNGKGPFDVKVKALMRDVSSTLDYINVRVDYDPKSSNNSNNNNNNNNNNNKKNPSFNANDIVLLVKYKDLLDQAVSGGGKGDNSSQQVPPKFRKCSLVGHTEHNRRAIDGLILKVSKKWWAQCASDRMVLLKIGCNVTALREFTALARVNAIPLRKYLLGTAALSKSSIDRRVNKEKLLDDMGGVGKGFAQYAKKKFNRSQLGAISAAAREYGDGGFTLIKGPPGTGKTTTLVALLNSLHIRQFNKYYEEVKRIATTPQVGNRKAALGLAQKAKPRLLVCAPSNAAVDNIILKIMSDGFVDGNGQRYNPSMVRIGVGQSVAVKDVGLEQKVEAVMENHSDLTKLDSSIAGYKMEIQRIQTDILRLRRRADAIRQASPWPLSKNWEIRIHEDNFEETGRVYFCNHKEKITSFEVPPPPEPGEKQFPSTSMPEYRAYLSKIVKMVERYNSIKSKMERCEIVKQATRAGGGGHAAFLLRQQLETHILDSMHIVMTTLGTAGNRILEAAAKFEVVVVDEAAQSVEPATLVALQLGSSHAILVGDPQQLPATIFSVSGRNTKYDRSLFQRLEEAGHPIHLLNTQYRMHPAISDFPRRIFYDGQLLDGPNVQHPEYGNPLRKTLLANIKAFQPFLVLDLDSTEERGSTSLSNSAEAHLAVHLFASLRRLTNGLSSASRVAVITPYAQQKNMLHRCFSEFLGPGYESMVEVNTVDAFQGREASIVIFSCVRAAGSRGIGFLSDVRRMNVALTRAKHFLFVIARCQSIVVNPYWRDLVHHARETGAVVKVPMQNHGNYNRGGAQPTFPDLETLTAEHPPLKPIVPVANKRKRNQGEKDYDSDEAGEVAK